MRYLSSPLDEFAVINHPLQSHFLHLHILTAPLLVLALGYFWVGHAWRHEQQGTREGRYSGLGLSLMILPMIFSGYGIQVSISNTWRQVWIWIHVTASLLWIIGYITNLMTHRKRSLENSSPMPDESAINK